MLAKLRLLINTESYERGRQELKATEHKKANHTMRLGFIIPPPLINVMSFQLSKDAWPTGSMFKGVGSTALLFFFRKTSEVWEHHLP